MVHIEFILATNRKPPILALKLYFADFRPEIERLSKLLSVLKAKHDWLIDRHQLIFSPAKEQIIKFIHRMLIRHKCTAKHDTQHHEGGAGSL